MVSIFLRSLVYNVLFYLVLAFWVIVGIPTYLMPRWAIMNIARYWARSSIWLMRVICNTKVEYRGLEKIPEGTADRRIETSVDVGNLRAAAVLRSAALLSSSASCDGFRCSAGT